MLYTTTFVSVNNGTPDEFGKKEVLTEPLTQRNYSVGFLIILMLTNLVPRSPIGDMTKMERNAFKNGIPNS